MAIFGRRRPPGDDLGQLLLQGHDMIEQTATRHREWGLGAAERWDVDQSTGLISWTFADGRMATAPVQLLGSFRSGDGWRWAWANTSILPELRRAAEHVRDYGARHGHRMLTEAALPCDEEQAADLAALAFRITRATGFYRGAGPLTAYTTFGDVTITAADGTVSTFRIEVGD